MSDLPLLSLAIVIPLLGGVAVCLLPRTGTALPKVVALGVSLVALLVSLVIAVRFSPNGAQYQFTELHTWIEAFGAYYSVGVDGIGLTLLLLTTILTPIVILASWNDADEGRYSANAFFAWMLILEGLAIGVFCATDVLLFYVLFEATLIPVYFLIGGFGGPNRSYAAIKFLLFNLFGGLLMLAAVVGIYAESAQTSGGATYLLSDLVQLDFGTEIERWLFAGFFISFAIKAPLFPVHTWLPDAASEATPGTAVLMVSVLDKIGTFGMIRLCLGLFPEASDWATPVVLALATISVVYGALLAVGQRDMMRLIALTSLSHFGFITMGIFVFNSLGQSGATLYMLNHGLSTALLFLVAGYLIRRRGTAEISAYGGVEKVAPIMAAMFLIGGLSTLSLPGLSPFVSEFMVLAGAFAMSKPVAIIAVSAIVLAALYILLMYQRVMTGPASEEVQGMSEISRRELAAVVPLVLLVVGLGFYPKPLLDVINPAVDKVLVQVDKTNPEPEIAPVEASHEGAK